jgi:AcrR family transcriptional regulator
MNDSKVEGAALARLHEAMLREFGEHGLDGLSLTAVLDRVGLTETDFARTYDSIEDCLFASYVSLADRLDEAVRDACREAARSGSSWPRRVRAGVRALLDELARDPVRAQVLVQRFPALGPRAQARFQSFVESFAPMLEDGRREFGHEADLPGEVTNLAVGAAEAILFEEIVSGRAADLGRLQPAITFSLLVPFVGPVRAGAEMRDAET